MYETLESTIGLQLDFELPPRELSVELSLEGLGSLLVEQSKGSKDKHLISLVVRGGVCHNDGETRFRCEIKRRVEDNRAYA